MREQIIDSMKRAIRPVIKHRIVVEQLKYALAGEEILSMEAGNDLIAQRLHQPGAAGKIGGTEMKLCRVYLRRRDAQGICTNFAPYGKMIYNLSGVYPNDNATLNRFCLYYLDTLRNVDVLAVWFMWGEHSARKQFAPQAKLTGLLSLEPYFHPKPWSAQLAGKRVVVVSPFARTIESQYQRREKVWAARPEVLPEFQLRTIRCPHIAALVDQPEYPDWFTGLEALKKELASEPFDVAIIGAGAWSIPLATHAKSLGGFGIHIGGATQVLFGITGKRWESNPQVRSFMNDYWTRPSEDERPKRFIVVENGCYW
ncbi:MAG: hypothetical protein ABSG31_07640 [Tepidisphaeraceae bacterium]|jgi:hypothetical protein